MKSYFHSAFLKAGEEQMKKRNWVWTAALVLTLLVGMASAQMFAKVYGRVTGVNGQPLQGAKVELKSSDTGRTYELETDKDGKYLSIGIAPATYDLTVYQNGQVVAKLMGIAIRAGEKELNVDLAEEQKRRMESLTEEQKKQIEAAEKERKTVKQLNDLLAQAKAEETAGNFEQSIDLLNQAIAIDASRYVLWYNLGDAHLKAAELAAGQARQEHYQKAVEAYEKGISIKPIGGGYNNIGEAYAKSGQADKALAAYEKAAELDPTNAGQYYFNLGAILTNGGQVDGAIEAFDKAIAADPNRAEAYYWKGVNLLAKATTEGEKIIAPPGTAEAFGKYLEIDPNGRYADAAKGMLTTLGSEVETTFKRRKK